MNSTEICVSCAMWVQTEKNSNISAEFIMILKEIKVTKKLIVVEYINNIVRVIIQYNSMKIQSCFCIVLY